MENLPADAPEIGADNPPDAPKKVRLLSLADLDGRTNAAKGARALVAELESDLGGADRLSAAEREIVQRAALASAMLRDFEANWLSGRGLDVAAYSTLVNTQSRLFKMLGLQRRPRDVTPTIESYLASSGAPSSAEQPHPRPVPPPPPHRPIPSRPPIQQGGAV